MSQGRVGAMPRDGYDEVARAVRQGMGLRVRAIREQQGLLQSGLADLVGYTSSAITQIEKGEMNPTLNKLIALAHALDVPMCALFCDCATCTGSQAPNVALLELLRLLRTLSPEALDTASAIIERVRALRAS